MSVTVDSLQDRKAECTLLSEKQEPPVDYIVTAA